MPWQGLNHNRARFFWEKMKHICIFYNFLTFKWHRELKSVLMEDKDLFIQHSHYYDCRWPGDARNKGISSHGIDPALPKYSRISTINVTVNTLRLRQGGHLFTHDISSAFSWMKMYEIWLRFPVHTCSSFSCYKTVLSQLTLIIVSPNITMLTLKWLSNFFSKCDFIFWCCSPMCNIFIWSWSNSI